MSKIYISAGHGGKDPGAVSGNHREKDYTLPISLKVGELLKSAGHEIFYARTDDTYSDITTRAAVANKLNADAVIDIHLNAGGGTGVEAWHSYLGGVGKDLAVAIAAEIAKLGYRNRGAKTRKNNAGKDYYGMIRQTKMPAVIIECCFIDNADDMAKMDTDKVAQAIAAATLSVFGGELPEPIKPTSPPTPTAIKKGDRVKVNRNARSYNGVKVAMFVYDKTYTVDELKGDRAVLDKGGIHTAFKVSDLTLVSAGVDKPVSPPVVSAPIKAGDRVKINRTAKTYATGQTIASWLYNRELFVREIDGAKILVSTVSSGSVTGWINEKDVKKV